MHGYFLVMACGQLMLEFSYYEDLVPSLQKWFAKTRGKTTVEYVRIRVYILSLSRLEN